VLFQHANPTSSSILVFEQRSQLVPCSSFFKYHSYHIQSHCFLSTQSQNPDRHQYLVWLIQRKQLASHDFMIKVKHNNADGYPRRHLAAILRKDDGSRRARALRHTVELAQDNHACERTASSPSLRDESGSIDFSSIMSTDKITFLTNW